MRKLLKYERQINVLSSIFFLMAGVLNLVKVVQFPHWLLSIILLGLSFNIFVININK